jgi:hypothetical protein
MRMGQPHADVDNGLGTASPERAPGQPEFHVCCSPLADSYSSSSGVELRCGAGGYEVAQTAAFAGCRTTNRFHGTLETSVGDMSPGARRRPRRRGGGRTFCTALAGMARIPRSSGAFPLAKSVSTQPEAQRADSNRFPRRRCGVASAGAAQQLRGLAPVGSSALQSAAPGGSLMFCGFGSKGFRLTRMRQGVRKGDSRRAIFR